MKRKILAILPLGLLSLNALAFDTNIAGFMALDLLMFNKHESRSATLENGIGVMDLKVYANQDNLSGKVKLDLDDSSIGTKYNIIEELLASYKVNEMLKITSGKGPVPFHSLHWGAMENTYIDGGTVLETRTNDGDRLKWTDVDNRIVTTLAVGNKGQKFINSLSFYGNSYTIRRNTDGSLDLDSRNQIQTDNSFTMNTKKERGVANKLEFFPTQNLKLALGGILFHNKINPKADSWALDFGGGYESGDLEVWFNSMYGFSSESIHYRYAVKEQKEHTYQLGMEYAYAEKWSFVANGELLYLTALKHDDLRNEVTQYKLDLANKYKLSPKAHFAVGVVGERRHYKRINYYNYETGAIELAGKVSFWF